MGPGSCICRMCFLQHFHAFTKKSKDKHTKTAHQNSKPKNQRHVCKIVYLHFKLTLKSFWDRMTKMKLQNQYKHIHITLEQKTILGWVLD